MNLLNKDKERIIPKKNYLYLAIIIIVSLLIVLYALKWYNTYNESKLYVSGEFNRRKTINR